LQHPRPADAERASEADRYRYFLRAMSSNKRPTVQAGQTLSAAQRQAILSTFDAIPNCRFSEKKIAANVFPSIEAFSPNLSGLAALSTDAIRSSDAELIQAVDTILRYLETNADWVVAPGFDTTNDHLYKNPHHTFRDYLDGLGGKLRNLRSAARNRSDDELDFFVHFAKRFDAPAGSTPLTRLLLKLASIWNAAGGAVGANAAFHRFLETATATIRLRELSRSQANSLAKLWRKEHGKTRSRGRPKIGTR
jgi:hypothetical protein